MPKRARIQKLRSQEKMKVRLAEQKKDISPVVALDPHFKTDLVKSILLAALIVLFEIALYYVYYQRVWERR